MARRSAPWHYFRSWLEKARTGANYVAHILRRRTIPLFSRIAGFGETFDCLAMSQRGRAGRKNRHVRGVVLLVTHYDPASVRSGLDEPVTPKKQINIVGQSDEEPEQ
jgi:hypothetical protein